MLTAFLKLDPTDLPESTSSEFRDYGTQELRAVIVLYGFYGNEATDEYHGRITRSEKLLRYPYDALELGFGVCKSYINLQKSKVREEFLKKEYSLRSKLLLKKGNKYSTKKSITKLETEIEGAVAKVKNHVTVEDLLKVCVVSGTFPNIRRLQAIYVIIPHAEAVLERGSSKTGQIMTKKRCALGDEMLMRISHRQELLKIHELNQVTDTWKSLRDRIIFSEEV